MTIAPWEYLFKSFSHANFPDIFHPTWIAAVVLLVVLTVLYNLRTRALHRHPPYLDMWEWIWWFLAAYETRLAKERYFTRQKYSDPEATIKKRGAPRRQGRQQRRRR